MRHKSPVSKGQVAQASAYVVPASVGARYIVAVFRSSRNRHACNANVSQKTKPPGQRSKRTFLNPQITTPLRFLRKHMDLRQEEFARLLRVNKTTLSKWENNEDPIGLQSDLLARAIVISRDKRLEKRAADHIRAFERIADQQKRVRVEVDVEKLKYEHA
ncbi:MAG: helix-turn-helix transcriptional regulator [Candidatus Acidiferrum sp.]